MSDDDLPPEFDILDDRRSTRLDRREFLAYVGASLAASACTEAPPTVESDGPGRDTSQPDTSGSDTAPLDTGTRDTAARDTSETGQDTFDFDAIPGHPFQLGVASGDPTPEAVILWTRLAPDPTGSDEMPATEVPVTWEIAETEPASDGLVAPSFDESAIVDSGTAIASPEWGHSVHVDVTGLEPDSWYTYRFRLGDKWTSRVGQTRTLPAPHADPDSFRVATACCQSYVYGYFTAHHHLAREDGLDMVFFLGDYIYEYSGHTIGIRTHPGGVATSLDEFRQRYALYKAEPQLRDAHAHCPWVVTWDDHEVRNNYAGDEPESSDVSADKFKRIRAAAYQAYYEHMPLRVPEKPTSDSLQLHRRFQVGKLVEFDVLDGRQHRSGISCDGTFERRCDEATDPSQSMLGDDQREWLIDALQSSSTTWQTLVQQVIFTPINFSNLVINSDMWDGYQAERQQIIDVLADDVANPLILTGDIHMGMMLDVPRNDDDPGDDRIAHEIVATSMTSERSGSKWASRLERLATALGQIRHFSPEKRGYCVLEFRPDAVDVHYRTVTSVEFKTAALETDASYRIARGSGDATKI